MEALTTEYKLRQFFLLERHMLEALHICTCICTL